MKDADVDDFCFGCVRASCELCESTRMIFHLDQKLTVFPWCVHGHPWCHS